MADFVAKVFCPSECVRLIQDQASMRNVDSRINSLRFDCCVFLFYSFSAVTFATQSANGLNRSRGRALRALEIDHQLEFYWDLDRKLARLRASENTIGVDRRPPKIVERIIAVGQQATDLSIDTLGINSREAGA